MAKICTICGKSSIMVWKLKKLRGKYNPTIKRRKYPNLQWVRLASGVKPRGAKSTVGASHLYGGHATLRGKKVKACAKCIKAMAKV